MLSKKIQKILLTSGLDVCYNTTQLQIFSGRKCT
jgi:hypothetical protein